MKEVAITGQQEVFGDTDEECAVNYTETFIVWAEEWGVINTYGTSWLKDNTFKVVEKLEHWFSFYYKASWDVMQRCACNLWTALIFQFDFDMHGNYWSSNAVHK